MIFEPITIAGFSTFLYSFLRAGLTVETGNLKNFAKMKEKQISDDIANEVVAVLKQDDTIKQLAQDGKESDFQSHIENSPQWSNVVTNISNQANNHDHSISVIGDNNITDSFKHSGTGHVIGRDQTINNYHGKDDDSKKH